MTLTVFDRMHKRGVPDDEIAGKLIGGPGDGCVFGIKCSEFLKVVRDRIPLYFETFRRDGKAFVALYEMGPDPSGGWKNLAEYSEGKPVPFHFVSRAWLLDGSRGGGGGTGSSGIE